MNKLQAALAVLVFFGLILLYVFEFQYFNRTLGVKRLVLGSVLIGLVLGGLAGLRWSRRGKDLTERLQRFFIPFLLIPLFMPLFGSLSNRLLSFRSYRTAPVEFVKEEGRYSDRYGAIRDQPIEPNRYYLFFYYRDEMYRVQYGESRFSNFQRGDTIQLRMKTGLWGAKIVD